MSPEEQANLISMGMAILFFGFATSMAIDEVKDYFMDMLRRKSERKTDEQ